MLDFVEDVSVITKLAILFVKIDSLIASKISLTSRIGVAIITIFEFLFCQTSLH